MVRELKNEDMSLRPENGKEPRRGMLVEAEDGSIVYGRASASRFAPRASRSAAGIRGQARQ